VGLRRVASSNTAKFPTQDRLLAAPVGNVVGTNQDPPCLCLEMYQAFHHLKAETRDACIDRQKVPEPKHGLQNSDFHSSGMSLRFPRGIVKSVPVIQCSKILFTEK
jgi:hypothetical protein